MFSRLVCVLLFPALITGNQLQRNKGISARIVGGGPVDIIDFPYQVSVDIGNKKHCGGAIINESYILSAGRCIKGYEDKDIIIRVNSSLRGEGGDVYLVKERFLHPNYAAYESFLLSLNPEHIPITAVDYDLSILELDKPLIFGDGVQPIRLPESNEQLPNPTILTISGWGATSRDNARDSIMSPVLRAVNVTNYSDKMCTQSYKGIYFPGTILLKTIDLPNDRMICGNVMGGGRNACNGDFGSPVTHNGVVYGLASWGEHCDSAKLPMVYTKIAHPSLREFIKKTTGM